MKRWIKRSAWAILGLVVVFLLIFAVYISPIGDAPRADVAEHVFLAPLSVIILPENAKDLDLELIQEELPFPIPRWLIKPFRPTSVSLAARIDSDDAVILDGLLAAPKGSSIIHDLAATSSALDAFDEIEWPTEPIRRLENGHITLDGHVPLDEIAKSDVDQLWNQTLAPSSLGMNQKHFIEGFMDNRIGEGYLAGASLLNALGIDLSEQNQNITISSFQFVRTMRFTFDIASDNALEIRIEMELQPERQNRLGAVNLKGGLSEAFSEWGTSLEETHGVKLTGKRSDMSNISRYNYRVSDARPVLRSLIDSLLDR